MKPLQMEVFILLPARSRRASLHGRSRQCTCTAPTAPLCPAWDPSPGLRCTSLPEGKSFREGRLAGRTAAPVAAADRGAPPGRFSSPLLLRAPFSVSPAPRPQPSPRPVTGWDPALIPHPRACIVSFLWWLPQRSQHVFAPLASPTLRSAGAMEAVGSHTKVRRS